MLLRVIDLVANLGGGVRFVSELLPHLVGTECAFEVEVVTTVDGAQRYLSSFDSRHTNIPIRALPGFELTWLQRRAAGRRGRRLRPLLHAAGLNTGWTYRVPDEQLRGAGAYWFPWVHRHSFREPLVKGVVGTFHDAIAFEHSGLIPAYWLREERTNTRRWFDSRALLTVTSNTTQNVVGRLFDVPESRVRVIPLAGDHIESGGPTELDSENYFICPANISPHKNHETLFKGYSKYSGPERLVLTGEGTDLSGARGLELRELARDLGLLLPGRLEPRGYLSATELGRALRRARALIMPTLGEGGGSFPVYEAVLAGVPVVCSDIPILREQVARMGVEVLWFSPRVPDSLTATLEKLRSEYPKWRSVAAAQAGRAVARTWAHVAAEYRGLFSDAAAQ